jgi:hypothetical protein
VLITQLAAEAKVVYMNAVVARGAQQAGQPGGETLVEE